jgi:oligoendopeptidase F
MSTHDESYALPHWDLTTIYSDLEGEDFKADFEVFTVAIAEIERFFDDSSIDFVDGPVPADDAAVRALEATIRDLSAVGQLGHKLYAFVAGYVATESRNTQAQTWMSKLQIQMAALEKLDPRFTA